MRWSARARISSTRAASGSCSNTTRRARTPAAPLSPTPSINEYLLGNGPIYAGLPPPAAGHARSHGGHAAGRPLHAAGVLRAEGASTSATEPVEVSISELSHPSQRCLLPRQRPCRRHERRNARSEGLFAAGDCATVSGGIAGAAVLGHIAGEGTVQRVRATTAGAASTSTCRKRNGCAPSRPGT